MSTELTGTAVGIGVDWGSSRLRACAFTASGAILASTHSDAGVLVTRPEELADVLDASVGDWRERWPGVPVVASGMIGSRNGLAEVPYVATPATPREVCASVSRVEYRPGRAVWIVPGLRHEDEEGVDVLRGEETALIGWMSQNGTTASGTAVLPGTHSKWVHVRSGAIRSFTTFPTGELFGTLVRSVSLAGIAEAAEAASGSATSHAYHEGLAVGLRARGLLHDYFAIRAGAVTVRQEPVDVRDKLSGLLVGYEIAEARSRGLLTDGDTVTILGEGPLVQRYRQALTAAGARTKTPAGGGLVQGWLAVLSGTSAHVGVVDDGVVHPVDGEPSPSGR